MPPCLDQTREVRLYGQRVGEIERLALHELAFRYDRAYARSPGAPPLSAGMATRMREPPRSHATAWFDGLLPEDNRRAQLAGIVGTTHIDTWSLLDAAGAECAGAVQIVNPAYEDRPALYPLEPEELAKLLLTTPVDPLATVDRSARMSLAGAQDKVALTRDTNGAWHVPLAGAPSTHILKPQSARFRGLVENEHWCMTIARHAGVDAAKTSIITVADTPVLVVERYDRRPVPSALPERIHQEDTAQALGATHKYEEEGGPAASTIARIPGIDPAKLLERMMLNWMLGNADGHAKNLSVLYPGTDRARLAPAYDLVCTETYDLSSTLAIRIGDAKYPGDVGPANITRAARAMGMEPEQALANVASLGTRLADAANRRVLQPAGLRVTILDRVRSRAELASRKLAARTTPRPQPARQRAPAHTAAEAAARRLGTPGERRRDAENIANRTTDTGHGRED